MRVFRSIFYLIIVFILALLWIAFYGLNSESFLDRAFKFGIKRSGLDIGYKSIKGGIYSGLKIEGFRYEDKLRADLGVDIDFNALKQKRVVINDLNISNLKIKRSFLESLIDSNSSNSSSKNAALPIDELLIKKAHVDLSYLSYKEYKIDSLFLDIKNFRSDLNQSFSGDIKLKAESNVAFIDLNSTLIDSAYRANIKADPKLEYLQRFVKDKNISIKKTPHIVLSLDGDLKRANFDLNLMDAKILYQKRWIKERLLKLKGFYGLKSKDLKSDLLLDLSLFYGLGNIRGDFSLNSDDINSSLRFDTISSIKPNKSLLNEYNITSKIDPKLKIRARGDLKNIFINSTLKEGDIEYKDINIEPKKFDIDARYNLIKKDIDSNISIDISSDIATLRSNANVALNLDDINSSLSYNLNGVLRQVKEFEGIDLSSFKDIKLSSHGGIKTQFTKLSSNKIVADLNSSNLKVLNFAIDTKKIYPQKIYKKLNSDLNGTFLSIWGSGSYDIDKNELLLKAKLKEAKYNKNIISSNEFELKLNKDEIELSPTTFRSGKFKLNCFVKKDANRYLAKIKSRYLNLDGSFLLDPLTINADMNIVSIKNLLKDIGEFYKVDNSLGVDGSLSAKIRSRDEKIYISVKSPKITTKKGRFDDIFIRSIYEPKKITIKNFDAKMRGFGSKKMNKDIRLAKDGVITFDKESASVDIELENLAHFKADKKGDVITANLSSKDLTLAYPKMGHTTITSDLNVFESHGKRKITGRLLFSDTEVNYESRYLDISKDSDIVIIGDKNSSQDDFIKNTSLDLKISSKDEILYKVRAGEVELKPNLSIKKDFGDTPRILGKIKILGGEYDLADKRFKLKEGAVSFRGLKEVNPLLDLHVLYDDIDEIVIYIDILGDKNRPKLKFSSNPPKSKKDIFSYLLFGMSASESKEAISSANKAAERIFGRAVSKDLARELNLDRLDMYRNDLGGINVKAGKKVNKKTIIYYQNRDTKSSIIVERKLNKNWDATVESGEDGSGIDFVFTKGFK